MRQLQEATFEASYAHFRGVGKLLRGSVALGGAQFAAKNQLDRGLPITEVIESVYEAGVTFGVYLAGRQDSIPTS